MHRVRFVRNLKLEPCSSDFHGDRRISADPKQEGFVDAGSLVSFTSNVTHQQKHDVLNSTLLAQLASNKLYDRQKDTENWYKFYTDVMGHLGWVMQSFTFDKYVSTKQDFKITEVTLELLSILAAGEEELVIVVQETLDSLAKSGEGLTLFSSNSTSSKHGNFQIVPCTVDKSEQLNVAFIGSYFEASQVAQNYFFVSYAKQDISLFKSCQVFTLDEDVYSQVRDEVINKLGKRAKDFVKNLDI